MRDEILAQLARIEADEQVRVLFAVESGSRAWGFESANSDWDVRFVYVRRHEDYLRLDEFRDEIEESLPNDLDVVGWDLKKALKLMHKCNPSIMEWLATSDLYREDPSLTGQMRSLAEEYFQPVAARHHYWSMAQTNFERNLRGETVSLKKYLYVIRPILACRWLESQPGWPAVRFEELVEKCLHEEDVREAVDRLITFKKSAPESFTGPRDPVLHPWLGAEIERLRPQKGERTEYRSWDKLNEWFRQIVSER